MTEKRWPVSPTDASAVWADRWPYKVHVLKTVQPYFGHLRAGQKWFEVRRNDRAFQPGDLLVLAEWDGEEFTGQDCVRVIGYVLRDGERFGLQPGFVVLGLQHVSSGSAVSRYGHLRLVAKGSDRA